MSVEGCGEQGGAQLEDHEGAVLLLSGHHVEEEVRHDSYEGELGDQGFEEEADEGQRRQQAQPGGDGVVGAHVQVDVAIPGSFIQGRQPEDRIACVEELEGISKNYPSLLRNVHRKAPESTAK